ncbi:oligopeptide ABC transporter periplasmic oligopeptide-binding protein, partial [mine drainage metagenome]
SYAPFQKLLQAAQSSNDNAQRYRYFEQAERVLGTQMPFIPLYFYTADNLVKPYVTGWHSNLLDVHPAQYIAILQHTVH